MKSKFEDRLLSGVGALIVNTEIPTHGKRCVIQHYDSRVNKYKVEIESSLGAWVAWYALEDLRLDTP